jgi:drug/metabolite transporter (DMT)-like permease
MEKNMSNILLILTSVLLNAGGQLLMRKGMLCIGEISSVYSLMKVLPQMVTNIYLWLSLFSYGVSIIIWMIVLSRVEVSFAYAFSSLGYIFVMVMSMLILREHLPIIRIIGIGVVFLGIILVTRS